MAVGSVGSENVTKLGGGVEIDKYAAAEAEFIKQLDRSSLDRDEKRKAMIAFERNQQLKRQKEEMDFRKKIAAFDEDALKDRLELEEASAKTTRDKLKASTKTLLADMLKVTASTSEAGASYGQKLKDANKDLVKNTVKNMGKMLTGFLDNMGNSINNWVKTFSSYSSAWNTRLQGTAKSFYLLNAQAKMGTAASPFIKYEDMLSSLNDLIGEGIVYNLEQRAFLKTISNKIATTFDVANSTLLRLIRIQQADSTQARLGMEAYLTQFLNATFQDTSYMTRTREQVSEALLGISSNLTRSDAVELEYVVQKWLGSLGSVGVSESTISSLAKGINALGTGNLSELSGNTALQNLLVMGANRAGISYSDMLTQGLKADTTNALLQGVITYLQDIASTDNQVIKSTYASIFGTTVEDLNAILNIVNDIGTISKQTLSYSGAVKELNYQLGKVGSRMHVGEMIGNLYSNAVGGISANIANNPFLYTTWLLNDLVEQATGGINIPFINAMGFGVDLNANVNQLIKLGIVGISTLGQLGNIVGGLVAGGGLNLNFWGYEDTTSRGTGFRGIKTGATFGQSQITYVGSSSGSDIKEGTLLEAYSEANETAKITGQQQEDWLKPLMQDNIAPNISTIEQNTTIIKDALNEIKRILEESPAFRGY